jgi:Domain of unknown function (DUF5666)
MVWSMQRSVFTRLTPFAIVAVAASTAMSVAACGSSSGPKTASGSSATSATSAPPVAGSPPASPSSPSAQARDHVSGLIASVSGNAIQVAQKNGSATVDFTPSTAVSETTAATLTDVTAGSCVTVRPTRETAGSSAVTARMVLIGTPANGNCSQPQGNLGGAGGPAGGSVRGTVASVTGDTIAVTPAGNASPTNVAVTNATTYAKRITANSQAVTQGKCIAARGTKDSSGTLQATTISLRPANNGSCGGARR